MGKKDSDNLIILDEARRLRKSRSFWETGRTSCPRPQVAMTSTQKNYLLNDAFRRNPLSIDSVPMPRIDFSRLLPRPLCDYKAIERSELGRMEALYDRTWFACNVVRGFLATAWRMLTLRGET